MVDTGSAAIWVEFYGYKKPGDVKSGGVLERVFSGKWADALSDTIISLISDLLPGHYCDLGQELQKAEDALKHNGDYVQEDAERAMNRVPGSLKSQTFIKNGVGRAIVNKQTVCSRFP